MGKMFILEIKRITREKSFWFSLLAGTFLMLVQIVTEVIPKAQNPLVGFLGGNTYPFSLYLCWGGGYSSAYLNTYLFMMLGSNKAF